MFNKKYNSGFLGDLLKIKAFYKLWANHIKKTDDPIKEESVDIHSVVEAAHGELDRK